MKSTPFSKSEAAELCEDFEDLIDTEFALGNFSFVVNCVIACPAIAPYRQQFLDAFTAGDSAADVDYNKDEYDVLIAVVDAETESHPSFIDIRDYIAEKGIRYNFPS